MTATVVTTSAALTKTKKMVAGWLVGRSPGWFVVGWSLVGRWLVVGWFEGWLLLGSCWLVGCC